MKVGVIGLGKMGLLHASILNTIPDVELTVLCDKSALIRRFCKKIFDGVKIVDDLKNLSSLNLDAIFVTTPIPSHFSISKTIYTESIARNVFVEKTLASSYDEAKELCELAQKFGGTNMVGYMKRFSVTYRKAQDLLDKDLIGNVLSFDAYAYSSDFSGIKRTSKSSVSRGGVLKDLGAHVIDLAIWFFGDLQINSAKLDSQSGIGFEDSAQLVVKAHEDVEGRFDISWCQSEYRMPEFGLIIKGTKGSIKVTDDAVMLDLEGESRKWYRHDLNDNVSFLLGAPEYYRENEYFIKSILNNGLAELNSFQSASKVDYTLDQINME